jgi:chemotaxis protein CheZ
MDDTAVKRPYTAEQRNGRVITANGSKVSNAQLLSAIAQLQALVVNAAEAESGQLVNGFAPEPAAAPVPETDADTVPAVADAEVGKVRQQIGEMAQTIQRTKAEIAAIKHPLAENDPVITASSQLDAIVDATESATQDILDATEQVEEVIKRMVALYPENEEMISLSDEAGGHLIKIMEACGFQDITGQRVTKVVGTLSLIEKRVAAIIGIWGADSFHDIPIDEPEPEENDDHALMSGPQLEGHGISQSDIDALFD